MRKLQDKTPGVGVILCDCSGTLRARLDWPALRDSLSTLPEVGRVEICANLCRLEGCTDAFRRTTGAGLKRLVLGVCHTAAARAAFAQEAAEHAGLNEGMLVSVGLREICHGAERETAGGRALDALTAAVRRAALLEPIRVSQRRLSNGIAVIGAGLAGMQAALDAAALGHKVVLLEKSHLPGGCAAAESLGYLGEDSESASKEAALKLRSLAEQVGANPLVRFMPGHEAKRVTGDFGDFNVHVSHDGKARIIRAGAVILAVGREREPVWPGNVAPRHGRLISLADFLERMASGIAGVPRRVAFIMGFACEPDSVQSASVWGAAERLAARRNAQTFVYCRNVQVAATGLEELYRRARAQGVVAVKFETPPTVLESAASLSISSGEVEESFDCLVVVDARAVLPVLPVAGLRPGPAGRAQADNVWMLPVESNRMGVAVIGAARTEGEWRESLREASAAAQLAHARLSGGKVETRRDAAQVDAEKCVFCLTCARTCPHGAIDPDEAARAAKVSELSCRRCGLCATVCPAKAIQLPRYTDLQLAAEIEQPFGVTVFACENSALPASILPYNGKRPDLRLIRVPCIGKVDARQILAAFEQGASRVCVLGCHQDACRYITGASHCAARVATLRNVISRAGLDPERLALGHMTEFEPETFWELARGTTAREEELWRQK